MALKSLNGQQDQRVKDKAKALLSETLFRNSLYLMLTTATMAGLGFVFWLIVAHLYPPDQVGLAATLIAALNFIANLCLLGLNSTFMRFLPRSKQRNEQIDTSLILVICAAVIAAGLFAAAGPYFAPKLALLHHLTYSFWFITLCIAATVNLITDSIFIAYRSAGYNLLVDGLIGSGTQLLLPLLLVSVGAFGIFAAQGLGAVVAMSFSIWLLIKKFNYRPRLKIQHQVIEHVRYYSLRSYTAGLLNMTPVIVVPILILNRLGEAPAGYYYLAFMMANALFSIAYAVAQSLFIEGAYEERELRLLTIRAAKFLGALMLPASIILAIAGPFILRVFGRTYGAHGGEAIEILAAAGPFIGAYSICSVILSITKQMRQLILMNLSCAVLVCGLSFAWVGRGLAWVALAWLIGHAVTAGLTFSRLARQWRLATHQTPA